MSDVPRQGMSHPSKTTRAGHRYPTRLITAAPDDYLGAFVSLFPPRVIQRIAREFGLVRRYRKLDPVAFLYTLAFETGPQLQRTVEALRHADNRRAPAPILSMGGFHERFTPELVEFLRQCVAYGLTQLRTSPGNRLAPKLARFTDLPSRIPPSSDSSPRSPSSTHRHVCRRTPSRSGRPASRSPPYSALVPTAPRGSS